MPRSLWQSLLALGFVVVAALLVSLLSASNATAESDALPYSLPPAGPISHTDATEALFAGVAAAESPPVAFGGVADSDPLLSPVIASASAPEVVLARAEAEQRRELTLELQRGEIEDYDPWQGFNEPVFTFNRQFDRVLVKPAATVWNTLLPDRVQRSLSNAFDNLGMPRRLLNNLLQLKLNGAARELTRFLLNTTIGLAGFFDVAKEVGIEKSDEDTGQTLAVYGMGPGPYLVLPFLPPLTIRDGIGAVFDLAMDPLNYVLPVAALAGMTGGKIVNERSVTLELFQNVEETVLDLYTAVRNAYLQRRAKQIAE